MKDYIIYKDIDGKYISLQEYLDAAKEKQHENKVFYRVPEMANVKVMLDGKTLVEDRLIVNQLGALLMAPMQNTLLKYDTKTGQIVNLRL